MGYYVRVFCKSHNKPNIRQLLEYLNRFGNAFKTKSNLSTDEQETNEWKNFELFYKSGKLPILVECNSIADGDGFAKEEIEEFIDEIGPVGILAFNKKKVIRHLQGTKYIVANQLATSDIDDDGYNANGEFLKYFADNCEGMIHADGEGFYEGAKIILKTE